MFKKVIGTVTKILAERPGVAEISVNVGGDCATAVLFTALITKPEIGDSVLLNTTAVDLGLGTGGLHFVIANLTRPTEECVQSAGHIMRLRYTSVQHSVMTVEEDHSPHRAAVESFRTLGGMPVVVGQLHSQIAPAAAAIKRLAKTKNPRVVYIMTDKAALPIAFSKLVHQMKNAGLIDATITVGQAFGGDYEAVTIYSALAAAKSVASADAIIVCQGPGNVGTGTKYGFSAIEMGEIINAVGILGGRPVAVPRISFADSRERHRGISHHTITALAEVALRQSVIALPMMDEMKLLAVEERINRTSIVHRHRTRIFDGGPGIQECLERGITLKTMGRDYNADPEFFLAASAAGAAAAEILQAAG